MNITRETFCRRIIWLGDLNYRINLSYEKTHELIARKEWQRLLENDQVRFIALFWLSFDRESKPRFELHVLKHALGILFFGSFQEK